MKKILAVVMIVVGLAWAASTPQVIVTWTLPQVGCVTPETCTYSVYRGLVTGSETLLKAGITPLTYTDQAVQKGTHYCYQVTASNQWGEGDKSNEHCITTPSVPGIPGNVKLQSP